jgi:hypothetical protein
MNPGSILIGLALLLITIPFVFTPLLNKKRGRLEPVAAEPSTENDQHTEGLVALRDLEFDHRIGKVTEEDYLSLRANLLTQIAAVLEAKEKQNINLDAQLEERIRTYWQSKLAAKTCGQCGCELEPSDRFCRACGTPVDRACPKCGNNVKATDRFCSACGEPVSAQQANTPPVPTIKEIQ